MCLFVFVFRTFTYCLCCLTLVVSGEVKVDLANFDVKIVTKFYIADFSKICITAEISYKSFRTSNRTSKKAYVHLCTYVHLFRQFYIRNTAVVTPHNPSTSAQFFCSFRPPKGRRDLPMNCDLQTSPVPVNVPIFFRSQAKLIARGGRSSVGSALCSF
jgi:hypothetical protein